MGLTPPRICVVDDDRSVRHSLIALMQCVGLDVIAFDSAEHFLDASVTSTIDFLVVDVRLPGISGIEMLEHLAENGWNGPAAVVTGNADIGELSRDKIHSEVHFLTKPCDPSQLLQIISKELKYSNSFVSQ